MRKPPPVVAALEPALPPLRAPRRRRGRRKFRAGIVWFFCAACGIGVLILFKPGPPAAPKPAALSPPPPPPPPPHKSSKKPSKSADDDKHSKKPPKSDDEPTQLRRFWLHQANQGMNQFVIRKLVGGEAGSEVAPLILDEYANTASAGSIIAFHTANGALAAGGRGLICSFGAGYSAGTVFVRKR